MLRIAGGPGGRSGCALGARLVCGIGGPGGLLAPGGPGGCMRTDCYKLTFGILVTLLGDIAKISTSTST